MIKTDIQIRFSDTDMLGHVNNVTLQEYFDLGKSSYFTKIVELEPMWKKVGFTTASTRTDYFEEVRVYDLIHVTTRVSQIGTKSIIFTQEIIDSKSGKVKSHSESVLVAFDSQERVSIEISKEWRDRIIANDKDIVIK